MPRANLSQAAVVDAAARLADRDGAAAVTVSSVAREVGVKPASLYEHVDGLSALLDGAHVLSSNTVATMGDNHVGALHAGALVSALPERSNDFRPTADGRGRWGLGFLINLDKHPGGRAEGSLAWAGLYNTYFWIDPASDVAGVLLTQVLPFADPQVLSVFADFERAVYALAAESS